MTRAYTINQFTRINCNRLNFTVSKNLIALACCIISLVNSLLTHFLFPFHIHIWDRRKRMNITKQTKQKENKRYFNSISSAKLRTCRTCIHSSSSTWPCPIRGRCDHDNCILTCSTRIVPIAFCIYVTSSTQYGQFKIQCACAWMNEWINEWIAMNECTIILRVTNEYEWNCITFCCFSVCKVESGQGFLKRLNLISVYVVINMFLSAALCGWQYKWFAFFLRCIIILIAEFIALWLYLKVVYRLNLS